MTPEAKLSTSGPIKEIDDDGKLSRRWFHVCPWCFGASLAPVRAAEIEADQVKNSDQNPEDSSG